MLHDSFRTPGPGLHADYRPDRLRSREEELRQWLSRKAARPQGRFPEDASRFSTATRGSILVSLREVSREDYRQGSSSRLTPSNPREISKDQKKVLAASLRQACTEVIADLLEHSKAGGHQNICWAAAF